MLTADTQFEAELAKRIDAEIALLIEHLANPGTVTDYENYHYRIGEIAGLRTVERLREETNTFLQER